MSLVSPAEVTALVQTSLTTAELQAVIDRVEAEVTEMVGEPYDVSSPPTITETHAGYGASLFVKRPIGSVVSVTEYDGLTDTTGTTMTADEDYFLWAGQGRLERIGAKWGAKVMVAYVPENQLHKRTQAIIDLVRVWIQQRPFAGESIGRSYSYTAPDNWEEQKQRIIRRLKFPVI